MGDQWKFTKGVLLDLQTKYKCFICKNLPRNPHFLWCKHSFCKKCILPMKTCPRCGFTVAPKELVPDLMLCQLLRVVNVTAEVSKREMNHSYRDNNMIMQSQTVITSNIGAVGKKSCNEFETQIPSKHPCTLDGRTQKRKTVKVSSAFKVNSPKRRSKIAPFNKMNTTLDLREKRKTSSSVTSDIINETDALETSTSKFKSPHRNYIPKSSILFSAKKTQMANKVNAKGETPLQIASRQGKLALVEQLLKDGVETNVKDYANWTPLCDAVCSGNVMVVRALLEAGAGVNTPSNLNTTALVEAVLKKDKAMVELLLNYGADMHQRTALNNTALSLADDELKAVMNNFSSIAFKPQPRVKTTPRAILASNLLQDDIDKVMRLCKEFNLTLSTVFMEDITHIVVEKMDKNLCYGSVTIMLGILSGCSTVGMDWVTASLEANCILPVDNFEPEGTNDHPHTNVFQKARLNKECLLPRLFDGCHISLLHNQTWEPQHKSDLIALIQQAGAHYHSREGDAERVPTEEQTIMFHVSPESPLALVSHIILYQSGPNEPLLKYNMNHIRSFPVSWFFKCIKTFSIL